MKGFPKIKENINLGKDLEKNDSNKKVGSVPSSVYSSVIVFVHVSCEGVQNPRLLKAGIERLWRNSDTIVWFLWMCSISSENVIYEARSSPNPDNQCAFGQNKWHLHRYVPVSWNTQNDKHPLMVYWLTFWGNQRQKWRFCGQFRPIFGVRNAAALAWISRTVEIRGFSLSSSRCRPHIRPNSNSVSFCVY